MARIKCENLYNVTDYHKAWKIELCFVARPCFFTGDTMVKLNYVKPWDLSAILPKILSLTNNRPKKANALQKPFPWGWHHQPGLGEMSAPRGHLTGSQPPRVRHSHPCMDTTWYHVGWPSKEWPPALTYECLKELILYIPLLSPPKVRINRDIQKSDYWWKLILATGDLGLPVRWAWRCFALI